MRTPFARGPMLVATALGVAMLALASCASRRGLPAGATTGEPIEVREVVGLAVVRADPERYLGRTLLVRATATAVCQNAGCWMQVEDEGARAMVRWESGCGGQYTFPKDAAGREVVIQGSFHPQELSEADAAHLEAEAPPGVEIARRGYELNASAILVVGG